MSCFGTKYLAFDPCSALNMEYLCPEYFPTDYVDNEEVILISPFCKRLLRTISGVRITISERYAFTLY